MPLLGSTWSIEDNNNNNDDDDDDDDDDNDNDNNNLFNHVSPRSWKLV